MKRVYVREEVCIGCKLCEIHCVVQHSRSKDIIKAFKKEFPRPLARVTVEEDGPLSFGFQCRHCSEPACLYACVSGAMQRDERGALVVDEAKCIGCWTCILACPYGAISRGGGQDAHGGGQDAHGGGQDAHGGGQERHFASKCDLCPGTEVPACVANCPNEALKLVEEDTSAVLGGSVGGRVAS